MPNTITAGQVEGQSTHGGVLSVRSSVETAQPIGFALDEQRREGKMDSLSDSEQSPQGNLTVEAEATRKAT